jgi:hypothetical protein
MEKMYYEIGKKTIPNIGRYANLDTVARGKAIVQDLGWIRARASAHFRVSWGLG